MPRVSTADRPSRLKLLLRRQRRRLRPALFGAAALLVVIGFGVLLRAASAAASPGLERLRMAFGRMVDMRVADIVVEGRHSTPEATLREALGVATGAPILGFSVSAAERRLDALSWVSNATVERRLPGTVIVRLVERRPYAVWQDQGRFVLIDRAGQVVATRDVADFGHLPLVVGEGAAADAANLLDALATYPQIGRRVSAAVRVGDRRWNLVMHGGTTVMLPEGHAPAALARLAELQASMRLLDRPLRAIDMRLPDRLAIRPVETAPSVPANPTGAAPGSAGASPNTASAQPGRKAT